MKKITILISGLHALAFTAQAEIELEYLCQQEFLT